MPAIYRPEPFLSKDCINECASMLGQVSETDPVLEIIATSVVLEVDVLLIGYFVLFKRQLTTRVKNFRIVLNLHKNVKPFVQPPKENEVKYTQFVEFAQKYKDETGAAPNNRLGRILRQYMAYAFLQGSNQPFVVKYGYYFPEVYGDTDEINPRTAYKQGWYLISERFIPLLYISEKSFPLYFTLPAVDLTLDPGVEFHPSIDELAARVDNRLTELIHLPTNKTNRIKMLGKIAFYKALGEAFVLNFYLRSNEADISSFQSGNLVGEDALGYYKRVSGIFSELSQKPLIYHFLYATLLSSKILPSRLQKDTVNDMVDAVRNLWGFVKDMVYGIQELALNIIDHATTKSGIITGRLYRLDQYKNLNPGIVTLFDDYLRNLPQHPTSFFDFNVIDLGEMGIVETLRENLEAHLARTASIEIADDIALIKENKVTFRDFIDPAKPLRLIQQAKRATAHLGLLALSRLVESNNGIVLAETWEKDANYKERSPVAVYKGQSIFDGENVGIGTNYNIVLPVRQDNPYRSQFIAGDAAVPDGTPEYISGFEKMLDIRLLEPAEDSVWAGNKTLLRIGLKPQPDPLSNIEYWDRCDFKDKYTLEDARKKYVAVCLDLENIQVVDQSKLFRFIGNWELTFTGVPLLLLNLKTTDYLGMLRLNNMYAKSLRLPFWNERSMIVAYSYVDDLDTQIRFYYTDILWGKSLHDFIWINKQLRKTSFNALVTDMESSGTSLTSEWLKPKPAGGTPHLDTMLRWLTHFGIFHNRCILLPFEIIIPSKIGVSIFENNVLCLLENDIGGNHGPSDGLDENIHNYFRRIQGYKVTASHFRIGSKLHVSNFYYAKRFFQNSFFAAPMALLLAARITGHFLPNDATPAKWKALEGGITLLGYGQYSELLLNLLEQFLERSFGNKAAVFASGNQKPPSIRVNHDLLSDVEDLIFLKSETFNKFVVPVIPISTTFSTSVKMIEAVRKTKAPDAEFGPYINVLYVANDPFDPRSEPDIEKKFGIVEQDLVNRTVSFEVFDSTVGTSKIDQSFQVTLKTCWQSVEQCQICFPQKPTDEQSLFVTDKSVVTPVLIFGYPVGRKIDKTSLSVDFTLKPDALKYGHFKEDNIHHLFFIEIEKFFRENVPQVKKWLKSVCQNETVSALGRDGAPVVLMAPNHYSNTAFLNLVNEYVFSNAATIVHYDVHRDNIQNFKLFYYDELNRKDVSVVFVDDVLASGETFIRTNFFLRNTREGMNNGFDAIIVLIDRSNDITHVDILKKLEKGTEAYFAFANIHLPPAKAANIECPMCREHDRYLELVANSFLDRLKYHFLGQAQKTRLIDIQLAKLQQAGRKVIPITKDNCETVTVKMADITDPLRYVRRADATHRIYQWFASPGNCKRFTGVASFSEWETSIATEMTAPFLGSDLLNGYAPPAPGNLYCSSRVSDTFLKVLTHSPFTQYKPLREKAFGWVLDYLDAQVNFICEKFGKNETLDLSTFRNLKFLIRRAGLLNQNYLISKPFFQLLHRLFGKAGTQGLLDRIWPEKDNALQQVKDGSGENSELFGQNDLINKFFQKRANIESLVNFGIFLTAQIKELLFLNEARSIRLERTILEFENDDNPRLFRQLLRMLREENGILIQYFADFFKVRLPDAEKIIYGGTSSLLKELEDQTIKTHYRYQTLRSFLNEARVEEPSKNEPLKSYLWTSYYLGIEQTKLKISLSSKTETIMRYLLKIVFDNEVDRGAFLIIKYQKEMSDAYFIAYNDGKSGRMQADIWQKTGSNYIEKFLNGQAADELGSFLTIAELKKQKIGKTLRWSNLYATHFDQEVELDEKILPDKYDHLLLMRLSNRTLITNPADVMAVENHDQPLGIVGFFGIHNTNGSLRSMVNHRYLLLLRNALSEFINVHHENSEFRDWIEADNFRKTALLTGHGREMLLTLANKEFMTFDGKKPYREIVATMHLIQYFIMDMERRKGNKEYIVRLFKDYFAPSTVTQLFFEDQAKKLVENMFELDEIENKDDVEVTYFDIVEEYKAVLIEKLKPVSILFSEQILYMILFEIFLNAKKNRWLYTQQPYESFKVNQVQMSVTQVGTKVIILLRNTGPAIGEALKDLRADSNPKRHNEVSGIYLIKKILALFKIGKLQFFPETIQGKLEWLMVELTLYPWDNEQDIDN